MVIGIIALLVGILLPALSKARQQGMKVQDLANIRSVAQACVMYANQSKGYWPRGDRGKGQGGDDLKWVHSTTYDYLLRALGVSNTETARDLAGTGNQISPDRIRPMSCNTLYELPEAGDYSGGRVDYYAGGTDNNPYAAPEGYDEMQMGWIYWGGREPPPRIDGTICTYPTGAATTNRYTFARRMGDRPTTQTLVTCFAKATSGYGTMLPHIKKSYASKLLGASSQAFQLTREMEGMGMAYTDGSARFVSYDDFGAVVSYAGGWFFYDRLAN